LLADIGGLRGPAWSLRRNPDAPVTDAVDAWSDQEVRMLLAKDKRGIVERVVALVGVVLLVPLIRKARRHEQEPHRRFPVFGH